MWLEHGCLFAGVTRKARSLFCAYSFSGGCCGEGCGRKLGMAVAAVAGHTTRLTSRLAETAASEKTLGPLDVTRDFGSPRPWDPWFGVCRARPSCISW